MKESSKKALDFLTYLNATGEPAEHAKAEDNYTKGTRQIKLVTSG
jgi:hypothetical protein